MFQEGQKVRCKESGMIGFIDDKEWENGWSYTIISVKQVYFYRSENEIVSA